MVYHFKGLLYINQTNFDFETFNSFYNLTLLNYYLNFFKNTLYFKVFYSRKPWLISTLSNLKKEFILSKKFISKNRIDWDYNVIKGYEFTAKKIKSHYFYKGVRHNYIKTWNNLKNKFTQYNVYEFKKNGLIKRLSIIWFHTFTNIKIKYSKYVFINNFKQKLTSKWPVRFKTNNIVKNVSKFNYEDT